MNHEAMVLVEFRNCAPYIYRIRSDTPIMLDRIVKHFQDTEDFNEDRDSITIIDAYGEITL